MHRKLFLVTTPILFLSAFLVQIYCQLTLKINSPLIIASAIICAFCILWMLIMATIYGSIIKKRWAWIPELLLFIMMTLAAYFQHKLDVDLIILVSPILFGIVYLVHFFMKWKKIRPLDFFKLFFIFLSLITYKALNLGSGYMDEIMSFWLIVLIILFILVWVQIYRFKETIEHPEIAENENDIFHHIDNSIQ